jgi:hypothetical protein
MERIRKTKSLLIIRNQLRMCLNHRLSPLTLNSKRIIPDLIRKKILSNLLLMLALVLILKISISQARQIKRNRRVDSALFNSPNLSIKLQLIITLLFSWQESEGVTQVMHQIQLISPMYLEASI